MVELPENNLLYNQKEYWDRRFSVEQEYDWLCGFEKYGDLLEKKLPCKDSKILILGCGNSPLSRRLYESGFRHVTNIDYSQCVIEMMQLKNADCPEMTWKKMDLLDMKFPDQSFDVVIEKATLDALLVGEKSVWVLSEEALSRMHTIMSKISALLKETGKFISLTFAQPHFRKPLLAKYEYGWSIETATFGDGFHFFMYIMQKGASLMDCDMPNIILSRSPSVEPLEEDLEQFVHSMMSIGI